MEMKEFNLLITKDLKKQINQAATGNKTAGMIPDNPNSFIIQAIREKLNKTKDLIKDLDNFGMAIKEADITPYILKTIEFAKVTQNSDIIFFVHESEDISYEMSYFYKIITTHNGRVVNLTYRNSEFGHNFFSDNSGTLSDFDYDDKTIRGYIENYILKNNKPCQNTKSVISQNL